MFGGERRGTFEVGGGARDFQDAVVGADREAEALDGSLEDFFAFWGYGAVFANELGRHLRIGVSCFFAAVALHLDFAGADYAAPHAGGTFDLHVATQFQRESLHTVAITFITVYISFLISGYSVRFRRARLPEMVSGPLFPAKIGNESQLQDFCVFQLLERRTVAHIRLACPTISTRTFLASAGLVTCRKNAMRVPRVPSLVFKRT